ncbi:MAG: hypothetical protein R3B84_23040 [Zavarzinella sp.]
MNRIFRIFLCATIFLTGCSDGKKEPKQASASASDLVAPAPIEPVVSKDAYLKKLKSRSPLQREAGLDDIAQVPKEAAEWIDDLLELLNDPTCSPTGQHFDDKISSVREAGVLALQSIGAPGKKALNERGIRILRDGLKDPMGVVREASAEALGLIGPDAQYATDDLAVLCADPDDNIRKAGYQALKYIKPKSSVAIVRLLINENPFICQDAATALRWLKPYGAEVVPHLVAAINSTALEMVNPTVAIYVRNAAAEALGGAGVAAEAAIPDLVNVINNLEPTALELMIRPSKPGQQPNSRTGAAVALSRIGKPAIPEVLKLLKSNNPVARHQAAAILANLGNDGVEHCEAVLEALRTETTRNMASGDVIVQLVQTGFELGGNPKEVLDPISIILADGGGNAQFASMVLEGVGRRGYPAVPELVKQITAESETEFLLPLVRALYKIGPAGKPAIATLAKKLIPSKDTVLGRDKLEPQVARYIILCLSQYGADGAAAIPQLTPYLMHPDEGMVVDTLKAFQAMGSKAAPAVPGIINKLKQASTRGVIQEHCLETLIAIGPTAKAAASTVGGLVTSKDSGVRKLALICVAKISPTEATVHLKKGLTDSSMSNRLAALRAIAELGPAAKDAKADLQAIVNKPTAKDLILWATVGLIQMGESSTTSVKIILDALADQRNRSLQVSAVECLQVLDSERTRHFVTLKALLQPPERANPFQKRLQIAILGVVQAAGPAAKEFIPELLPLLADSDQELVRETIQTLKQLGIHAIVAAPQLRDLVRNDLTHSNMAYDALQVIDPPLMKEPEEPKE